MLYIILLHILFRMWVIQMLHQNLGVKGLFLIISNRMLLQFSFIVSLMTSSWYINSTISYGSWITLLGWDLSFSILYDQISIPLTLIVGIASSIIIPFAREYICDDSNLWYFMNLLLTFTSFMLILTSYDNLVIIFVGWEGVGLISYLLISFWSHRRIAIRRAMKAILVNRVGDIFYVALIFRIILRIVFRIIFGIIFGVIMQHQR